MPSNICNFICIHNLLKYKNTIGRQAAHPPHGNHFSHFCAAGKGTILLFLLAGGGEKQTKWISLHPKERRK